MSAKMTETEAMMIFDGGDHRRNGLNPFIKDPVNNPLDTPSGKIEICSDRYRETGYPACPDHTEKASLWQLLDVEKNAGIHITESFAMLPAASVSGFYFSHPESRYFSLGKINRDQLSDYSQRKGMDVGEAERWLAPNLGYK